MREVYGEKHVQSDGETYDRTKLRVQVLCCASLPLRRPPAAARGAVPPAATITPTLSVTPCCAPVLYCPHHPPPTLHVGGRALPCPLWSLSLSLFGIFMYLLNSFSTIFKRERERKSCLGLPIIKKTHAQMSTAHTFPPPPFYSHLFLPCISVNRQNIYSSHLVQHANVSSSFYHPDNFYFIDLLLASPSLFTLNRLLLSYL